MTSRTRQRLAFIFASALFISCDNATQVVAPPQGAVTGNSVVIVSGDAQFGASGTALSLQPTIKVVDATGKAVARVTGTWSVTSGGGAVSATTWKTASNGQASVSWTLGASGTQTLTSTLDGGGSVTFTATILAIAADSGNGQVGTGGTLLPQRLVVKVVNASTSAAVANATGKWIVTSGSGTVSSPTFTTDANGRANVQFTMGATGAQQVTAVLNSGGSVVFNETIAGISIFDGNNQITSPSTLLPLQPTILVRDPALNPIPNISGTWTITSGGGSLSTGTFTTDGNGKASVAWTVGAAGAQSLTATLNGGASVVFNASIATIAKFSGDGQIAAAGSLLSSPVTVIVRDGSNNPVANASGTWVVAAGGGLVSSPTFTTDALGKASVNWTLGASGPQTLTATLNGGGGSVSFAATVIAAGSDLVVVQGDGQRGRPGVSLSTALVVELHDASNVPISGASVQWTVQSGNGTLGAASQTTDGAGRVTNVFTLGWSQYQQTVKARVAGVDSVTFTATVDTANMRFTIVSGSGQTAPAATTVPQPLIVQLKDTLGNAIAGAPGTFAVVGGGSISKSSLSTSAAGRDSVTWTLGSSGTQQVVATIAAIGSRTFTATIGSLAPPAGSKLTIVAGNSQKGTPKDTLLIVPTIEFRDPSNNVVAGATVDWSIEAGTNLGGIRTTSNATGSDGRASNPWILGWAKVGQTLKAKVAGYDSVTFTATLDTAKLRFRILSGNNQSGPASTALTNRLVVELKDTLGVAYAGLPGTFAITAGGGSITKTQLLTGAAGSDSIAWTLGASGTQTVTASNPIFGTLTFNATIAAAPPPSSSGLCAASTHSMDLTLALGETKRYLANDAAVPYCLNFDKARDTGKQFLLLFEDHPPLGDYTHGYFKGTNDANIFGFTVSTSPPPTGANTVATVSPFDVHSAPIDLTTASSNAADPYGAMAGWDSPTGPLYELQPVVVPSSLQSMQGKVIGGPKTVDMNSVSSALVTYNVGDTIIAFMNGITRLSIASGNQKAVVRKVTNNIVFAEDVRLGTVLVRENGTSHNTPLTDAQMTAIATEFDTYGAVQNSMLFNNTFNQATIDAGNKIVAIHTLMSSNSTWGYTLSNTNIFMYDYWVGTTDGATASYNQNAHRVADNLFTHESAHTRHYALNATTFSSQANGIAWVEGFARFTEKAAMAHRLLLNQNFSRTANATLPKDPALGGAYFVSDVPDFTKIGGSAFTGYDAFAFFFDYFADQYMSKTGGAGDWRAAIRSLLVNGGTEAGLNSALGSFLPGETVHTLMTKSRIALYADDYVAGLPSTLQYLEYNLRLSRSSSASDPRALFPKVVPGSTYTKSTTLSAGSATGFLIDGAAPLSNAAINITNSGAYSRGVVSVTRIK